MNVDISEGLTAEAHVLSNLVDVVSSSVPDDVLLFVRFKDIFKRITGFRSQFIQINVND